MFYFVWPGIDSTALLQAARFPILCGHGRNLSYPARFWRSLRRLATKTHHLFSDKLSQLGCRTETLSVSLRPVSIIIPIQSIP